MITIGDLRNNKDLPDDLELLAMGASGILVLVTKDDRSYLTIEEDHNDFSESYEIDPDDAYNGIDPFADYKVIAGGESFYEYYYTDGAIPPFDPDEE